ncbi:MAG: metallophosphoesterase [Clostridia bacterium]|nr:metallophosphoesterase [Clostridia bacterium]
MINLTHTKLHIGLEKPVKILQITDVHLTYANEEDTPRHQVLMKKRFDVFREEGNFPPHTPKEYFEQAIALAKEENALLVCTGDVIDIHTHGNLEVFREIIKGEDMMFSPGGHEHQRRCVRTMEEDYPYWETIRPQLESEFPEFDLYFESRIINGLNIITADNSLEYFPKKTVDAFKKELEKGLPIIVFFHDYIWEALLNTTEPYHPNVRLTKEDYQHNSEMIDLLLHHPLVITTFAGHGHRYEERTIDGKTHYATDGLFKGDARMIEIF